jgi:predicted amidohydrolase
MSRLVRMTMVTIHARMRSLAQRRAEVLDLVEQAGQAGTDIVLLPECADHHRTHEAVAAHDQGREAVRESLGLNLESPWLAQIAALARKHKMVVIPCIVHNDGPKTYDAAMVFGPDGSLLGSYNQTHLAPGEMRNFDPGNHLDVISTPFGKLGLFICWDMHFPEITRVYELKGVDILLWTTMRQNSWAREFYQSILPGRCLTHGVPMGVSTYSYEDQLINRVIMNSVVLDSFGQTLAGGMQPDNALVQATVDLDLRAKINRHYGSTEYVDYVHHVQTHRRPDLYGILTAPVRKSSAAR